MEARRKAEREVQQQQRAKEDERLRQVAAEKAAVLREAKERVAEKERVDEALKVSKLPCTKKGYENKRDYSVSTDIAIIDYIARNNITMPLQEVAEADADTASVVLRLGEKVVAELAADADAVAAADAVAREKAER